MRASTWMVAGAAAVMTHFVAGQAHAAKPSWCKEGGQRLDGEDVDELAKQTDPRSALYGIVADLCYPNAGTLPRAGDIEAIRQEWSKKLHLTDDDWKDVGAWAQHSPFERQNPDIPFGDSTLAWSVFTPVDQYAVALHPRTDLAYQIDALGPRLSQSARVAYALECVRSKNPVEWATCEHDLHELDAAKLADELRGDNHGGYSRITIRLAYYELAPKLAKHAEAVQAIKAKDPGYAKMFELAEKAREDFVKADPKLVELMDQMDDARVTNSRKASEGCEEKTWEAFKQVVSGYPAKKFAGIHEEPGFPFLDKALAMIYADPNGYLAATALQECELLTKRNDHLVKSIGGTLSRWPGFRGPRTAAQTAILTAGIELDDRGAKIDYPKIERNWLYVNGSSSGGGVGVVASVKVNGDKAVIEFAKEKHTNHGCAKGHSTNRVIQVDGYGRFVYEYICEKETSEDVMVPPAPPQTVDARYAQGLKAGMFVHIAENLVMVAFPKGSATPAFLAGVPLK